MEPQYDWKTKFVSTRQLLGCYFNQDFEIIDGSVEGALAAAIRGHRNDAKFAVISELAAFLAISMPEEQRLAVLYGPFGCEYYVEADGYTATTWLAYVKRRFEESLEPQ